MPGRYNIEQIAAVAFLTNLGMRIAVGNVDDPDTPWGTATDLMRASYRHGVLYAVTIQPSAPQQHEEWRNWRRANSAPPHEDDEPWELLRPQERDKDELFLNTVLYLASR